MVEIWGHFLKQKKASFRLIFHVNVRWIVAGGDRPRARVVWESGGEMVQGARVQLRFTLANGAKIYSWWMTDDHSQA